MQRRSTRVLHRESDPVPVRTPSKRAAALANADADAVPPPLSDRKEQRSSRKKAAPRRRTVASDSGEEEPAEQDEFEPVHRVNAFHAASAAAAVAAAAASPARASSPSTSRSTRRVTPAPAHHQHDADVSAAERAAPSAADVEDVRDSTRFLVLRSVLLLLIFAVLYTLTTWYVLEPLFQPHRTAAYKEQQARQRQQHILQNICPPGQECSYDLKDEFKG